MAGMLAGLYLLKYSPLLILLTFGSLFFIFYTERRWNKSQKNKENLEQLELERINATLDFDITRVDAENDIYWYPDDIINDEPIGFNESYTTQFRIELVVYNPCVIENVIRNIEVYVVNKKKNAQTGNISSIHDLNTFPVSIPARKHLKVVFYADVDGMQSGKGDKLRITIISMDNKKTEKEYELKYFSLGPALQDRFPWTGN